MFKCNCCDVFVSLNLKTVLSHVYQVHSLSLDFKCECIVDGYRDTPECYNVVDIEYEEEILDNDVVEETPDPVLGVEFDTEIIESHVVEYIDTSNDIYTSLICKRVAASFILTVKEENKLTQVAVDSIIESTKYFINRTLSHVQKNLTSKILRCGSNHQTTIDQCFENISTPFEGLETAALQQAYIKNNFSYVQLKEIALGTVLMRKKIDGKSKLFENKECFIYIPILESLKQLISNKIS
nr:uncharacterized protein LOC124812533 [Hydra vulgaris]